VPDADSSEESENETTTASETAEGMETTDLTLVTSLPSNVGEAEYNAWIEGLRARYPIEIDWELWEKIEKEDAR